MLKRMVVIQGIEDCAKDGRFTFFGKDDGKKFLINKLCHSAAIARQIFAWTCYKSLSRKKQEKEKKLERLVILGMLINIHELSSLASIFKMTGLLSTVSSKLESAIVKEHRSASLYCIIVLSLSI